MTNTIPNVPRELLERILGCIDAMGWDRLETDIRALLSAPSPAGVDGLEVVAWWLKSSKQGEDLIGFGSSEHIYAGVYDEKIPLCDAPKAQAIIDGLRVEVERLQMQLAACGVVALANTIESAGEARQMHPDYMSASFSDVADAVDREIALRTERDQQAQRIGDLEGLLMDVAGMFHGPGIEGGPLTKLRRRIDAALSAGKESE